MAAKLVGGKLFPLFTRSAHVESVPACNRLIGEIGMVWLALAIFVAVFGWGGTYFGWHDPEGKVRLALFTCFVLGALSGYKSKGD